MNEEGGTLSPVDSVINNIIDIENNTIELLAVSRVILDKKTLCDIKCILIIVL